MGVKLTKEQQERLIMRMREVMSEEVLEAEDALAILDVLINACKREKQAIDPMGFVSEFIQ